MESIIKAIGDKNSKMQNPPIVIITPLVTISSLLLLSKRYLITASEIHNVKIGTIRVIVVTISSPSPNSDGVRYFVNKDSRKNATTFDSTLPIPNINTFSMRYRYLFMCTSM